MNTDLLIAELARRFPDQKMSVPGIDRSLVSFHSPHPEVGDLLILDDGNEFTVYIGRFTHCHFELDDELDTPELAQQQAVDDVADYIEAVLADRIEFYGGGPCGGSRVRTSKPRGRLSRLILGAKTFVWSGPIESGGR